MDKLASYIDRQIGLLKIKIDVGMGTDSDIQEYKELQKALPNVLSDLEEL